MKARIHFSRIGKKDALYVEDLLHDDGVKVITHSHIPPEFRKVWAKDAWVQKGIMTSGEIVSTLYRMVQETRQGVFPSRYIT